MQELPVIITAHIHSTPSWTGVEDDNIIKINPQQTVSNQIPNRISLNVINAQSICGPSGKLRIFLIMSQEVRLIYVQLMKHF